MQNKNSIRPLTRQFYRGNGWRIGLGFLETLALTASNLMVSWLIQQIIDMTTGLDIGFSFRQILLLSIACLLLDAGAYLLAYISKPKLIAKGIGQYQEYVFGKLCQKGISAFSGENSARYLSALSNDAASIETNYLENIFVILNHSLLFIGAICLMFYYSPLLTFISIGLSLLPLLGALLTGNLVANAEKQVSDRNEAYMVTLKDSLAGFSVIKSFRAEARICSLIAASIKEVTHAKTLCRKLSILVNMLSNCAGSIVQLGVFLIGAYLALNGYGLSAGSVLVFVQLLNYVISPIATIPQALAEQKAARALIRKAADSLAENIREEGTAQKTQLNEGIFVRNLSFAYEEEKNVLKNVDFTFESGKSYAIVGASGSGKSTLLSLLTASHPNYSGQILYDNTELRELRSDSLYELISNVQQNVFIFNASIRDNITMFSEFPKEEVDRAIALSGLSQLIENQGEDYLCGENGSGLSGGEKQRIAIARGLLKHAQVLLADEATAALDTHTAHQVSNAILDLSGITRIVVTHALDAAMLKRYDCILTMKNGSIVEQGSFGELMENKDYFYSLYTLSQ